MWFSFQSAQRRIRAMVMQSAVPPQGRPRQQQQRQPKDPSQQQSDAPSSEQQQ